MKTARLPNNAFVDHHDAKCASDCQSSIIPHRSRLLLVALTPYGSFHSDFEEKERKWIHGGNFDYQKQYDNVAWICVALASAIARRHWIQTDWTRASSTAKTTKTIAQDQYQAWEIHYPSIFAQRPLANVQRQF